ncbi:hypothetical protein VTN77DRAFT_4140 [Rasamsonia byssochlamydoides]|uniref:uncharacterized protein n=1 Tax=Rasamsonia byssochlamydoides TaxID=89139 RepID=UPI0037444B33
MHATFCLPVANLILQVYAHHRNMCRYPSANDQNFVLVEAAIKEIISVDPAIPDATGATMLPIQGGFERSPFSSQPSNDSSSFRSSPKTGFKKN